jgi:hypothetical protein
VGALKGRPIGGVRVADDDRRPGDRESGDCVGALKGRPIGGVRVQMTTVDQGIGSEPDEANEPLATLRTYRSGGAQA